MDENGTDSDDLDSLTNSINRLSIENSKNIKNTEEGDKEISDVVYDGSKLAKIKVFSEYQASITGHWKQI